jgi:hypothetical protein
MAFKMNAVKQIGTFDGTEDVERWINRLEMAIRIDEVPNNKHADVLAMSLRGAAYATYTNLSAAKQADAAAIKVSLRGVFGLRRMEAWRRAAAHSTLLPGDMVDVVFDELRTLVTIATAAAGAESADPVGRMAACLLLERLPPAVRDQVLLNCGQHLKPEEVIACAKELLPNSRSDSTVGAAVEDAAERPADRSKRSYRCYKCSKVGHIARDCTSKASVHGEGAANSAVSGNGVTGQPRV